MSYQQYSTYAPVIPGSFEDQQAQAQAQAMHHHNLHHHPHPHHPHHASPYSAVAPPPPIAHYNMSSSKNNSLDSLGNYASTPPQLQGQPMYSDTPYAGSIAAGGLGSDEYLIGAPTQPGQQTPYDEHLYQHQHPQQQHPHHHHHHQQHQQQQDMMRHDSRATPTRTVYLGNVPSDITPKELLDHVRSGIIENVKIIPNKNYAFISFLDESSALLFHSDAILKRLTIKQNDIRIGWGKNTQLQPVVANSVNRYGATRNVYLGNLDPEITEEILFQDLSEFGPIDTIKLIPEKKIAFVHFTSILDAIRVVQNLPLNERYQDKKIFYGKDRCAFITKTQQHNAAQYLGLNPNFEHLITNADREFISTALVQQSTAAAAIATSAGGANNLGNRTVYLGNLHPDSTIEEICNVVRGGILQNIRLISERHVCFITFIDPIAAAQFFAMSSLHGLIIHNRKIKIGWGKHSGPLSNALTLAVGNGASRNIYLGGLELSFGNTPSSETQPEANGEAEDIERETGPEAEFEQQLANLASKLRTDFEEFGEIEQINFFVEKNCAFINFTNISNAIKAIDGIKYKKDYANLKINFGKDRCGNIPRQFQSYNSSAPAMAAAAAAAAAAASANGPGGPSGYMDYQDMDTGYEYENSDSNNGSSRSVTPNTNGEEYQQHLNNNDSDIQQQQPTQPAEPQN